MVLERITRGLFALAFTGILAACGGGGSSPQAASSGTNSSGGNGAPSIQGKAVTDALANQSYSFAPSAADPNGDPLTFTATNLPEWATIDPKTGTISGTPTSGDVGTYSGIVVTVSDGRSTAALPSFSITVSETATGSAMLSWLPPTQNTDGSTLTDLSGFQVLYGRSPDQLDQTVTLKNSSLSSYLVENLTSGTWYFTVVALNSAGVSSPLSNIASKTIS